MDSEMLRTDISRVEESRIYVRNRDLANDVMGHVSFTQMIFLILTGRMPKPSDEQILDAALVSLVDHGMTSSALASRLTYRASPEAMQAAVAAGLLGAGSQVLGAMENCGKMLSNALSARPNDSTKSIATRIVTDHRDQGLRIPGLGHLIHKSGDVRATRLFNIAKGAGHHGPFVELLHEIARELNRSTSRPVSINIDGSIAAVLLELGFDWRVLRGFALISRVVGLVAHIDEERQTDNVGSFMLALMREQSTV